MSVVVFKEISGKRNWVGMVGRYAKTKYTIRCPKDYKTGVYKTGLSKEDQKRLEDELGISLSPNKDNKFWQSFKSVFRTGGIKYLDLTDPLSEVEYKMLLAHDLIAKDEQEAIKYPMKMFMAYDPEKEADIETAQRKIKSRAYSTLEALSHEEYKDVLLILGKLDNAHNATDKIIENKLGSFIDGGKKNQERFLEAVDTLKTNPEVTVINKAISKNIIRENKGVFYLDDNLIGYTLEEALTYIKKSPKTKKDLMERIEANDKIAK